MDRHCILGAMRGLLLLVVGLVGCSRYVVKVDPDPAGAAVTLAGNPAKADRWSVPTGSVAELTATWPDGQRIATAQEVLLRQNQWFFADAWLSVSDKLLMILVCGSFLVFPSVVGNISIQIFLITQTACTTMALIISSLILYKNGLSFSFHKFPLPDTRLIKSVLPFGMLVLLMSAHYRLDGFLLERLHHNAAYEAGIYAGAYRLLDAANMIGFLLASFLLPFIARQYSRGKNITAVVINSRHLLLQFSLGISIAVFILAPWVQEKLYDQTTDSSIDIFPNPTTDYCYIHFDHAFTGMMHICDIHGQEIIKSKVSSQRETNIDVSGWDAGIYFINFIDNNNTHKQKRKQKIG